MNNSKIKVVCLIFISIILIFLLFIGFWKFYIMEYRENSTKDKKESNEIKEAINTNNDTQKENEILDVLNTKDIKLNVTKGKQYIFDDGLSYIVLDSSLYDKNIYTEENLLLMFQQFRIMYKTYLHVYPGTELKKEYRYNVTTEDAMANTGAYATTEQTYYRSSTFKDYLSNVKSGIGKIFLHEVGHLFQLSAIPAKSYVYEDDMLAVFGENYFLYNKIYPVILLGNKKATYKALEDAKKNYKKDYSFWDDKRPQYFQKFDYALYQIIDKHGFEKMIDVYQYCVDNYKEGESSVLSRYEEALYAVLKEKLTDYITEEEYEYIVNNSY